MCAIRAVALASALGVGGLLAAASTAAAEITSPPGRCVGTATFQQGYEGTGKPFTVDSRTLTPDQVLTVPAKDTVAWTGELIGVTGTNRPVSGSVRLELPFGQSIELGTWGPTADSTSERGTYTYDYGYLPRGVEITVSGEHSEQGAVFCSGAATVELEGGAFDTPYTAVSIGGLTVSVGALALAGRPRLRVKGAV